MFLNSGKIEVAANSSAEIKITVPTKYLASYDYTNAKTYILDKGTYYFTAAAGAHQAVNNVLAAQGYGEQIDTDVVGVVETWELGNLDSQTFSTSNGVDVTNVADNADLNYWLPDTVTYLSRSDWDATWPINYNTSPRGELCNKPRLVAACSLSRLRLLFPKNFGLRPAIFGSPVYATLLLGLKGSIFIHETHKKRGETPLFFVLSSSIL